MYQLPVPNCLFSIGDVRAPRQQPPARVASEDKKYLRARDTQASQDSDSARHLIMGMKAPNLGIDMLDDR